MSLEQGLREIASAIRYYADIEKECSEKECEMGMMAVRMPETVALQASDRVPQSTALGLGVLDSPSDEALCIAGRVWQMRDMSHITMDSFQATRIARILDQVLEEYAAKPKEDGWDEAGDA